MKVDEETWRCKAMNFQKRITEKPYPKKLNFYSDIVKKVHVGEIVLDVGAGSCILKECIPANIQYYALDPYPRNDDTIKGKIEDADILHLFSKTVRIETVFALASLDNTQDLNTALENIAKIATKNVVIITGIGLEPDNLHTVRVDMADFKEPFKAWTLTVMEEIWSKVFLLEFTKS